jgi:hypothetical protein
MLKDERGFLTAATALLLPLMLLFTGLFIDYGRCHVVRGELQTAVDAAALAGASAARPVFNRDTGRWEARVQPEPAERAAREAFRQNLTREGLERRGVLFEERPLAPGEAVGWRGEAGTSPDSYRFAARVRVRTLFVGPLAAMVLNRDFREVPVYAEGAARAVLRER